MKKQQSQKRAPKQPEKPKHTTSEKAGEQKKLEQLKTTGIIFKKEYQEKKKGLQHK